MNFGAPDSFAIAEVGSSFAQIDFNYEAQLLVARVFAHSRTTEPIAACVRSTGAMLPDFKIWIAFGSLVRRFAVNLWRAPKEESGGRRLHTKTTEKAKALAPSPKKPAAVLCRKFTCVRRNPGRLVQSARVLRRFKSKADFETRIGPRKRCPVRTISADGENP